MKRLHRRTRRDWPCSRRAAPGRTRSPTRATRRRRRRRPRRPHPPPPRHPPRPRRRPSPARPPPRPQRPTDDHDAGRHQPVPGMPHDGAGLGQRHGEHHAVERRSTPAHRRPSCRSWSTSTTPARPRCTSRPPTGRLRGRHRQVPPSRQGRPARPGADARVLHPGDDRQQAVDPGRGVHPRRPLRHLAVHRRGDAGVEHAGRAVGHAVQRQRPGAVLQQEGLPRCRPGPGQAAGEHPGDPRRQPEDRRLRRGQVRAGRRQRLRLRWRLVPRAVVRPAR